jgi:hypothetical protein
MKPLSLIILWSLFIISCNPVGEKITEEKPVDMQLVNTVDGLNLKKGDIVVVWSKLDASFIKNGAIPSYEFIYNLSLDGNTVDHSSTIMFADKKHIINSTYKKEEEEEPEKETTEQSSDYNNEADSTKIAEEKEVTASWEFEQKVTEIPIKKDGKYTLDYKVRAQNGDTDSMFNKIAIILRKK